MVARAAATSCATGDRVLVIDDNSPDGTGRARRPARGRARRSSTSCTASARRGSARRTSPASAARSTTAPSSILEMDCDFSHDPQDVPRLIAAAEAGADLVLGSRYVPGGRVGNWGIDPARDLTRRVPVHGALPAAWASRTRPAASSASGARVLEDARPRRDHRHGLRLPDRDDLPREARAASASSRSRSRSPTAPPGARR